MFCVFFPNSFTVRGGSFWAFPLWRISHTHPFQVVEVQGSSTVFFQLDSGIEYSIILLGYTVWVGPPCSDSLKLVKCLDGMLRQNLYQIQFPVLRDLLWLIAVVS
jgi:hypothetical protein